MHPEQEVAPAGIRVTVLLPKFETQTVPEASLAIPSEPSIPPPVKFRQPDWHVAAPFGMTVMLLITLPLRPALTTQTLPKGSAAIALGKLIPPPVRVATKDPGTVAVPGPTTETVPGPLFG